MNRVKTLFFKRQIETTGSYPSEFECSDGNAYIVKHSENGLKHEELIREAVASKLLAKLGIPTPDIAAVEIIPATIPGDYAFARHRPAGIGFGSRKLHRSTSVTPQTLFNVREMRMLSNPTRLASDAPETLVGIGLFDVWLFNADRSFNNPNLVIEETADNRLRFVAIDHAAIFSQRSFSQLNEPTALNEIFTLGDSLIQHPIFQQVKNMLDLFFEERVKHYLSLICALNESGFESIFAQLPSEWNFTRTEQAAVTKYLLHRQTVVEEQFFDLVRQGENL